MRGNFTQNIMNRIYEEIKSYDLHTNLESFKIKIYEFRFTIGGFIFLKEFLPLE